MVWSLSKDDDGLEPAVPTQRPSEMAPSSGPSKSQAAPSVVVDPVSQIPAAPTPSRRRQRAAEPTRILSSRKIDELRAQVEVHRRQARQKKMLQFMGWGVAGALAVAAGGILAGGVLPRLDAQLWKQLSAQLGGEPLAPAEQEKMSPPNGQTETPRGPAESPSALPSPSPSLPFSSSQPQPHTGEGETPTTPVEPDGQDGATPAVSLDELEAEIGE